MKGLKNDKEDNRECMFCNSSEIPTNTDLDYPAIINAVYKRYPGEHGRGLQLVDKENGKYYDVVFKYCPLCGKELI